MEQKLLYAANFLIYAYLLYLLIKSSYQPKGSIETTEDLKPTKVDCSKCQWTLKPGCTDQTCDKASRYICRGAEMYFNGKKTANDLCSVDTCPEWPVKGCSDGSFVGSCTYVKPNENVITTETMSSKSQCLEYPCQTITTIDTAGEYTNEICPRFQTYAWLRNN